MNLEEHSVKMKLAIILFILPCILGGYVEQYKGFNNCGIAGWFCNNRDGMYDITYQCNATGSSVSSVFNYILGIFFIDFFLFFQSARVWIWTARLPSNAKTFTIRDCLHLEIHTDCTKGSRSNILSHVRVINVTKLEFLEPLAPGVFLHDNDRIPQAPPSLHLEDIGSTNFYPGLFDAPGGACRYKQIKLNSLKLKNVRLEKLEKSALQDQILTTMDFEDVTINSLDSRAISVTSNDTVNISNCKFGPLPPNAILIKGQKVSFCYYS